AKLKRDDFVLFSESNSRFLVEVQSQSKQDFEKLMKGGACSEIGSVKEDGYLSICGLKGKKIVNVDLVKLREAWKTGFEDI
ncbi:MAG: hypothetical protein OEX16_03920, partial [Hadesarchaea archaeon]|nr:hypothetical protein [Hadesarchaea archaeon]